MKVAEQRTRSPWRGTVLLTVSGRTTCRSDATMYLRDVYIARLLTGVRPVLHGLVPEADLIELKFPEVDAYEIECWRNEICQQRGSIGEIAVALHAGRCRDVEFGEDRELIPDIPADLNVRIGGGPKSFLQ